MTNPRAALSGSSSSTLGVVFPKGEGVARGHPQMTTIELSSWISVNNLFQNARRGRIMTPEYRLWKDRSGWELLSRRPAKIQGPVSVLYEYREGRADLGNLLKAPEDLLVTHGVIEGDGPKIVRDIRMTFADVEGVRVTICPV